MAIGKDLKMDENKYLAKFLNNNHSLEKLKSQIFTMFGRTDTQTISLRATLNRQISFQMESKTDSRIEKGEESFFGQQNF